jgi:cytochrome b6-f complex subunit 4
MYIILFYFCCDIPLLFLLKLLSYLTKGLGLNSYGEPAWPNDIFYVFPIIIFSYFSFIFKLNITTPYNIIEKSNPFATPLEILPEWYFFSTFNLLHILLLKLIGVLSTIFVIIILLFTFY